MECMMHAPLWSYSNGKSPALSGEKDKESKWKQNTSGKSSRENPIKMEEYSLVVSVNTNESLVKYQVTKTKPNAGR